MIHQESVRLVPGAQVAVLLIHGICGSPNHFRELIKNREEIYMKHFTFFRVIIYNIL